MSIIWRYKGTIIWVAIICVLSFSASKNFPKTDINFADLIVHVIMYAILAIIMLFERNRNRYKNVNQLRWPMDLWLITVFVGIFTEVVQHLWITSRTGEWTDGVANVTGSSLIMTIYSFRNMKVSSIN